MGNSGLLGLVRRPESGFALGGAQAIKAIWLYDAAIASKGEEYAWFERVLEYGLHFSHNNGTF